MNGFGGNGIGGLTQAAATVIQHVIPPRIGSYTRVRGMAYADLGTAHTLTFLRPLGKTTVASAAALSQAVVNFTADPGAAANIYGGVANAIAANDFVVVRTRSDMISRLYKVSSVATLAITMTANVAKAMAIGDDIWFFGITTDTDNATGAAHPKFLGGAGSTKINFPSIADIALVASLRKDEPILFNSNNATNAGTADLYWDYGNA